jgi:nitrogen fixation NifU-like protein
MDTDDIENLVKELQKKIEQEEEEDFSQTVIKEYRNPIYFGIIENPDYEGEIIGPCGDTMKIMIKTQNEIIKDSKFWTDGCGPSIACGNMLLKMIIGKTIQDAKKITSEQLLKSLDGLPKDHKHCAKLAVNTLQKAISK